MAVTELPARSLGWRLIYYMRAVRRELMLQYARCRLPTSQRPLILVDPDFYAFNGHHPEFCQLLIDGLSDSYRISLYCRFDADFRVVVRFRGRPIFFEGMYFKIDDSRFMATYASVSCTFAEALGRILPRELRSDALFLMPTVTQFSLGGLAEWYSQLLKDRRPTMVLIFHFGLDWNVPEAAREVVIEKARSALVSIADAGKLRIGATTSALAQRLTVELGLPCIKVSLPIRWPNARPLPPEPGAVFGLFGGLRLEKGAALLAEAIPRFVAEYPDSRFIVHAPAYGLHPPAIGALENLPQVEIIRRTFASKDEYFGMLCRAGCILLPYDPAAYAYRASAVLIEARGLGRMVIATRGISLDGEDHEPLGTFIMSEFTVDALLKAMAAARRAMLTNAGPPVADQSIQSANSPAAFCQEIERLAR